MSGGGGGECIFSDWETQKGPFYLMQPWRNDVAG